MRNMYLRAVVFGVMLLPGTTYAAHVFLEPAATQVSYGETFYVPIRIDTGGACVNAVRVELAYDPSVLSVQDITTGDSLLTLFAVPPTIAREGTRETGSVVLEGGVPGGYCGRVMGDPGRTDTLARLVVTTVPGVALASSTSHTSLMVLPGTQVILHDGLGTPAPLTVAGVELTFQAAEAVPENPWLADVKSDTVAPELFDITLVTGPSVGNQRHYIVFSTTDKQSGLDHFEVLETDPDRFGILTWVPREAHWVRGESPYVLRDQKLHSKIMVKAIDKAGNERVVEYTPPMSPFAELTTPRIALPLVLLLVLFGTVVVILVRRRHNHHDNAPTE